MNVLITGGAGFIGSHLAERLHCRAKIRILDDLSNGSRRNITHLPVDLVPGSILKEADIRRAIEGIEIVFHLAAAVSAAESMENPLQTVHANTIGALNVLQAASRANVKKLVFASSAAIYGSGNSIPKVESMRPQPESPYAATKWDGEFYCDMFRKQHGLPTVALRFFNVFGPRQRPDSGYAAVVPSFIARARRNLPLEIHGDGEQTRDFIYVKDVASALDFVAMHPDAAGVFNCGYGTSVSINRLARDIIGLTNSSSKCQHSSPRAGDVRHSMADPTRLMTLGWKPEFDLETGLAETVTSFHEA